MLDKRNIKTTVFRFTEQEKHQIIEEMLSTQCTKRAIWKKYTGRAHEHGQILSWMREFGYNARISARRIKFESNFESMAKKNLAESHSAQDESFENLQLKIRIAELEKQLKDAELKAIAFSTMIDIAEKELQIPIRKKFNTKPSGK